MDKIKSMLAIAGLVSLGSVAQAGIIGGLSETSFSSAVVEDFNGPYSVTANYDFGNGMVYTNLNGNNDHVNYTSSYGMGSEPSISDGLDGSGDGYFGTGPTPTTFEFAFAAGVSSFGFYGAESSVPNGSLQRNGELDISFYDLGNNLIDSLAVSTAGTFAWDQFHGFMSDSGSIGRVVFNNVGHMVLDNVTFGTTASVSEPGTLALLALGLAGFGFSRKKHARS